MTRDGILLLGGTGFIGRALAQRLNDEGREVHVLGRHNTDQLEYLLPRCHTVVHLASATTPGSSANHPDRELNNFAPALHLLELMQHDSGPHLIFFSSGGAIYGNPDHLPIAENAPLAPLSYYGASKAALEMLCHAFRSQGHAVTILRPSNAYGPGQLARSGFGLIPTMLECIRDGIPLEIWGDGENVRDFIYIDDITEACTRLMALPQDNGTYNLGSGRGVSINQLRHIVEQVTGIELKTSHHPARGIDVRAVVLDNSHLEARLAWKPQTSLEEGVRRTLEWSRNYSGLVSRGGADQGGGRLSP